VPHKREPILGKQENDYRYVVLMGEQREIVQPMTRIEMRADKLDFNVIQTLLANDGSFFFLASEIVDRKSEKPQYYLLNYKNGALTAGALILEDVKNLRQAIIVNGSKQILLAGYYEEAQRFNPGIVFFSTLFDADNMKHSDLEIKLIANEILLPGLSKRQKKRSENEQSVGRDYKHQQPLTPIYSHLHPSGDISLIAEVQFVTYESSGLTMGGALNRIIYNYNELFITRMDDQGKVKWIKKIPKLYQSNIDLMQSFHLFDDDECLHFFFNDNKLNLDMKTKKGVRYVSDRLKNNFLAHVYIDNKGKESRKIMIDYSDDFFNKSKCIKQQTNL
jgi:hypothetical protein